MAKATKKKKVDPFKKRKTKTPPTGASDTLTPPDDIAKAIDAFRECQEQARHFEGEATIHKDSVLNYSQSEYVKRLFNGQNTSFKVLGEETMVTYVVMDSSAGLTEEDVEEIRDQWGDQAADELVVPDYRSIRFDPEILEANYEEVVQALQVLPEEVLENLFKPMLMKAKPGAVESAKKYAKTKDQMLELIGQLKIKNYIR